MAAGGTSVGGSAMNGMIDAHDHVPAAAIAEAAASGIAAAVLTPIVFVAVMAQSPTPTT